MNELVDKYRDYTHCMASLCNRTSNYYNRIKQMIEIPLIFTSSILAILNSSMRDGDPLRILNISINTITAILINMMSRLKIAETASSCKELAIRFDKLGAEIEKSRILNDITQDKINSYIKEYDILISQTPAAFPYHIKKQLYDNFKDTNISMPFVFNGYVGRRSTHNSFNEIRMTSNVEYIADDVVGRNL